MFKMQGVIRGQFHSGVQNLCHVEKETHAEISKGLRDEREQATSAKQNPMVKDDLFIIICNFSSFVYNL